MWGWRRFVGVCTCFHTRPSTTPPPAAWPGSEMKRKGDGVMKLEHRIIKIIKIMTIILIMEKATFKT